MDFPARIPIPFPSFLAGCGRNRRGVDPKKGTYCQTSKKKKKQQKSTSSEPAAGSKMNFQEPFTASQDIRQQNSKGSRCLKGIFGIFPVFFSSCFRRIFVRTKRHTYAKYWFPHLNALFKFTTKFEQGGNINLVTG